MLSEFLFLFFFFFFPCSNAVIDLCMLSEGDKLSWYSVCYQSFLFLFFFFFFPCSNAVEGDKLSWYSVCKKKTHLQK